MFEKIRHIFSKEKSANPWVVFSVILVGGFMALIDVTIVNVALPSIQTGLHTTGSALEWIVSGYALAIGLLLIPAGRVGDNIGHRKTFLFGLALFTLASLGCALSQNSFELIACRIIQGAAAGIYTTSVTAIIQLLFSGKGRSRAFSIFGATVGLATAIGPLLGGFLVQIGGAEWGWRLVFLVNVPIGALLLPFAFRMLPKEKGARKKHSLDLFGVLLLTIGLVLIFIPLVEGQKFGWPWWTYLCFALSIPVFIILWFYENKLDKKGHEPLLTTHLLRHVSFAGGSFLSLIYFAAFTGIFFTLSILWQSGLGRGALATGFALIPFAIGSMVASSQSDKFSACLGRGVLFLGSGLVALGLFGVLVALHLEGTRISAWAIALPLLIAGIGNGLFIAPNMDFVLKIVPGRDAGAAAGILNTGRRVGSAIGIAAVGTMLFSTLSITGHSHLAVATAFSQSAQLAFVVSTVLAIISFFLVFTLPKDAPLTS